MFFEFVIDPQYDPKTTPRPVVVGFSTVFVCFLSFTLTPRPFFVDLSRVFVCFLSFDKPVLARNGKRVDSEIVSMSLIKQIFEMNCVAMSFNKRFK